MANSEMRSEVMAHLTQDIIPFWEGLRDNEKGGFICHLGFNL